MLGRPVSQTHIGHAHHPDLPVGQREQIISDMCQVCRCSGENEAVGGEVVGSAGRGLWCSTGGLGRPPERWHVSEDLKQEQTAGVGHSSRGSGHPVGDGRESPGGILEGLPFPQ